MTHTIRLSILVASTALLSACAPLQQAPLLYSSKMTVGLDLSMATSETPGGSIAIGFKNVDAAYVPVAVSKDAISKDGVIQKTYEITKIEAIYGEGSTSAKISQQTEDRKEDIKKYLEAKQAELAQAAIISSLEKDISQLNTNASKVSAAKIAYREAAIAAAAVPAAASDIAPTSNPKENYDNDLQRIKSDLDEKNSALTAQREKYIKMQSESDSLFKSAADAANLLRTDKRDAMSVYGRFNSRGGGEITGSNAKANLTAGKIFSTGVASQNLTEAAKIEATQYGATECINKVSEIIGPAPIAAATSASAPAAASAPGSPKEPITTAKIEAWRANAIALLTSLCKPTENQQSGKK